MSENRKKTGQFVRGKSGNPGGRPKRTEEQKKALDDVRALAPTAARTLRHMLTGKEIPAAQRLKAVEIVLERTYGKPEARVEVSTPDNGIMEEIRKRMEKDTVE